ncbi:hypothetical protein K1719_005285 [Acacia pycnantha]|nr:hypothetical protein K1719_005285 [Acacia pycnantha]
MKLWSCNFNSQLANALIIEGDYRGSISALECGFACAREIGYPELQMFFATSILHVHLMQWDDDKLVEQAVNKCNKIWDSIESNEVSAAIPYLAYCFLVNSSEPKSEEAVSNNGGPSVPDHSQTRRYKKKQHHHKKNLKELTTSSRDNSLTLEDSSAGFKTPRRKIHPSSSRQVPRHLISEAKDSMCLDRPMMMINNYWEQKQEDDDEEEEEGKSECLSVVGVKEEVKRVRFKLPHVVIFYSPEVEESQGYYCNTTRDDPSSSSFYLTLEENFRGSDGSDEFSSFSLAVDTLPRASFSSGL